MNENESKFELSKESEFLRLKYRMQEDAEKVLELIDRTLLQRITDYVGVTSPFGRKVEEIEGQIGELESKKEECLEKLTNEPGNPTHRQVSDVIDARIESISCAKTEIHNYQDFLRAGKKVEAAIKRHKLVGKALDFFCYLGLSTPKRTESRKKKVADYFSNSLDEEAKPHRERMSEYREDIKTLISHEAHYCNHRREARDQLRKLFREFKENRGEKDKGTLSRIELAKKGFEVHTSEQERYRRLINSFYSHRELHAPVVAMYEMGLELIREAA